MAWKRDDFRLRNTTPFELSSSFHTGRIEGAGWSTMIPFHQQGFKSFEEYIDNYGLLASKKKFDSTTSMISKSIFFNYPKTAEPRIVVECVDSVIVELI